MKFEYDPTQSRSNKAKHGIDFEEAQRLWQDPWLIEAPARADDELRFMAIGVIDGKHWAAICVRRSEAIRIISVRRARRMEVQRCESL